MIIGKLPVILNFVEITKQVLKQAEEFERTLAEYKARGEVVERTHKGITTRWENGKTFKFRRREAFKLRKDGHGFCKWHIKTDENETDCSAHLHEGRVFACPYTQDEAEARCSDCKVRR